MPSDQATCSLCWAQFPTTEELAQHEEMERAIRYDLSADTHEPSTKAESR